MSASNDNKSYIQDVVINDTYKTGGYPVKEIINNVNNVRKQLGGNAKYNSVSKFESLVIPLGLHAQEGGGESSHKKIEYKSNDSVIEDSMFDKLFNNVAKIK